MAAAGVVRSEVEDSGILTTSESVLVLVVDIQREVPQGHSQRDCSAWTEASHKDGAIDDQTQMVSWRDSGSTVKELATFVFYLQLLRTLLPLTKLMMSGSTARWTHCKVARVVPIGREQPAGSS